MEEELRESVLGEAQTLAFLDKDFKNFKELINFVAVKYKNWNEKLFEGFIRLSEQVEERIGDLENYLLRLSFL